MAKWEKSRSVKGVGHAEVRCYMDNGFDVRTHQELDPQLYAAGDPEPWQRVTYVLACSSYDGENINLFDLQAWFDRNRDWINELKKECGE